MNFFTRLFQQKHDQKVPTRPQFRVQFNELSWRSNPEYVKTAADLLATSLMKDILGVLYAEIPSNYPQRGTKITDTEACIELGRMQGYQDCLLLLQRLGEPIDVPQQIAADWGADKVLASYDLMPKE